MTWVIVGFVFLGCVACALAFIRGASMKPSPQPPLSESWQRNRKRTEL